MALKQLANSFIFNSKTPEKQSYHTRGLRLKIKIFRKEKENKINKLVIRNRLRTLDLQMKRKETV